MKSVLKITSIVLSIIILLSIVAGSIFYYQFKGKYSVDGEKYQNPVGHINPKNIVNLDGNFTLCGSKKLIGYYSSAAPKIYKGGKYEFRNFILSNFQSLECKDSGYLNLRFRINCKGQVGHLEINELDINFQKSDLSDGLVDQIVTLITKPQNWDPFSAEENNYYMYLNFKIQDGEIFEILP